MISGIRFWWDYGRNSKPNYDKLWLFHVLWLFIAREFKLRHRPICAGIVDYNIANAREYKVITTECLKMEWQVHEMFNFQLRKRKKTIQFSTISITITKTVNANATAQFWDDTIVLWILENYLYSWSLITRIVEDLESFHLN